MSVRARLILCFALVTVALTVPTLFAIAGIADLRRLAVERRVGQASTVARLGRMQATLAELDRLERSFIATADITLANAVSSRVDSLGRDFGRLGGSPYAEPIASLGPVVERIGALTQVVGEDVRHERLAEATATFGDLLTTFDQATRQLAVVADSVDAMAARDVLEAEDTTSVARARALIGLGIALLLTLVVAGVTTRTLTNPLRKLGRASARVADGEFELGDDLPYDRRDEIGELSNAFATMARRLGELDRTKAEFLGIVSHELKTPLNVIKAYAELIEEELGQSVSEAHRSLISAVGEQANVMSSRVSRLMDLSRLEAGAYRLAKEWTQISALATGVERMFERLGAEKGVRFETRISDSAPREAMLDVDIVRDEVLGNLIVNALRFTPRGGWVELCIDGDEGGVVFTVTDSGPGIPDEHHAHIFEKYYTGDRARAVGSGLGLAIAKEMVQLHGGMITLEQGRPGSGACFRVALPISAGGPDLDVLPLGLPRGSDDALDRAVPRRADDDVGRPRRAPLPTPSRASATA